MKQNPTRSLPGVTGDGEVGLETELSVQGRFNFTNIRTVTREESPLEERLRNRTQQAVQPSPHRRKSYLNEELSIERARSRVERSTLKGFQ